MGMAYLRIGNGFRGIEGAIWKNMVGIKMKLLEEYNILNF